MIKYPKKLLTKNDVFIEYFDSSKKSVDYLDAKKPKVISQYPDQRDIVKIDAIYETITEQGVDNAKRFLRYLVNDDYSKYVDLLTKLSCLFLSTHNLVLITGSNGVNILNRVFRKIITNTKYLDKNTYDSLETYTEKNISNHRILLYRTPLIIMDKLAKITIIHIIVYYNITGNGIIIKTDEKELGFFPNSNILWFIDDYKDFHAIASEYKSLFERMPSYKKRIITIQLDKHIFDYDMYLEQIESNFDNFADEFFNLLVQFGMYSGSDYRSFYELDNNDSPVDNNNSPVDDINLPNDIEVYI